MPRNILFVLIYPMLVISCTTSRNTETSTYSDSTNLAKNDSLFVDSLSFVDFIHKFEVTGEFYTDLYFAENFNFNNYNQVAALGDEVVYQSDEMKRTIIPIEKARPFFNLTGLSKINVFDQNNRVVTTGQFRRIEYVEDLLESRFVAVFNLNDTSIRNYTYCIGSEIKRFDSLTYIPVEKEPHNEVLINYLQVNPERLWSIHHYEVKDAGVFYSTVSADTTAYIVETVDQRINILYKSKSNEAIHHLVILPKYIGGKPVLLIACGQPETDLTWSSLLIFLGDQYQVATDHRLRD